MLTVNSYLAYLLLLLLLLVELPDATCPFAGEPAKIFGRTKLEADTLLDPVIPDIFNDLSIL